MYDSDRQQSLYEDTLEAALTESGNQQAGRFRALRLLQQAQLWRLGLRQASREVAENERYQTGVRLVSVTWGGAAAAGQQGGLR